MVTVVIPVYRAENTLHELGQRLDQVLGDSSEVIFVDDVGGDGSWKVIESIIADKPHWRGVQLGRNSGQHAAILAGIRRARCPIVVTMDDDLQHLPEEIPTLVEALTDDLDLVYGTPVEEEHGAARSLASRGVKWMMRRTLAVEHAERIGAFRCFRTNVRDAFSEVNDPYVSIDVLLSWGTGRVGSVAVDMATRESGTSGYTLTKLIRHTFDMVTGYSAAPLRLVAYVGLLLGLLGFGSLTYVLVRFILGESTVPGFTFLASLLSLVGGIQMIAIAVIGEYLGRVHFRAMRRPSYHVRRVIGDDR